MAAEGAVVHQPPPAHPRSGRVDVPARADTHGPHPCHAALLVPPFFLGPLRLMREDQSHANPHALHEVGALHRELLLLQDRMLLLHSVIFQGKSLRNSGIQKRTSGPLLDQFVFVRYAATCCPPEGGSTPGCPMSSTPAWNVFL